MASAGTATSKLHQHGLAELLIEGVYVAILIVTCTTWTVAGFLVWVPLLIRTTTALAVIVFYSSLFNDQARISRAEHGLHFAVRFYSTGFEHFINFYRHRHATQPPGLLEPLSEMRWRELLVQCLWVVGAWSIVYFSAHSLFPSILPWFS